MRISLGDVSLWFDVSGPSVIPQGDTTAERPVVVAVHGGPGLDHMTVKSALGPLAGDFQVVYFDLRGHGRSDHSSAEFWNVRSWADDLRRLCDALGQRQPVVLGSSFGGNVVSSRRRRTRAWSPGMSRSRNSSSWSGGSVRPPRRCPRRR